MNEFIIIIGYLIGGGLTSLGILKTISYYKKKNLVQCTGCNEIMNKKEFDEHKRTYHNMLGPKERMTLFKSWLKTQYEQGLIKNTMPDDKIIKQGCLIADISKPTARRIIQNLKDRKVSSQEKFCQCCGFIGTDLNVRPCLVCNNLFCEPYMSDHPCFEGKSNSTRPISFGTNEAKKQ